MYIIPVFSRQLANYLSDIDRPPSPASLEAAHALVSAEILPSHATTPHPLLPSSPTLTFTPLVTAELARIAANEPLNAIDLTRYEAPSSDSPTASDLTAAYTSSSHLSTRLYNLGLLEQYGKNAWLVGNSQLEDLLKGYEKELVSVKGDVEIVDRERMEGQLRRKGEVDGLEEAWKLGIGRVVEVEVAIEELRREMRERTGA